MNTSIASIKEIALAVGCSPRVASAVLSPGNSNIRVGEATQQKIVATAREMGYRTNELARTMATGKSRVLGVVTTSNTHTEHGGWMIGGAIEAANQHGYLIKVLSFKHNQLPSHVIERCMEWRLGGLLVLGMEQRPVDYLYRKALEFNIPIAVTDNIPDDYKGIGVSSDDRQGIFQVVEHLISQGHRRIGFLGGDPLSTVSQKREAAFREVITQFALPLQEAWILQSHWYQLSVIEDAVQALLHEERPSAIVCAGDPLAMVLIRSARALGIKVPEQLSVTGFANFYLSDLVDPPLTTIEQSFSKMGRVATEELIFSLQEERDKSSPHSLLKKIPTYLIVRASTAPPDG